MSDNALMALVVLLICMFACTDDKGRTFATAINDSLVRTCPPTATEVRP